MCGGSSFQVISCCPQKKCFGCEKVLTTCWPRTNLLHQLFFIFREKKNANSRLSVKTDTRTSFLWSNARIPVVVFYGLSVESTRGVPVQVKEWMMGCVTVVNSRWGWSPLHDILDARQRLLYWHRGIRWASLLSELQDGHVAQWTHFPHLQPLNEAPEIKKKKEKWVYNQAKVQFNISKAYRMQIFLKQWTLNALFDMLTHVQ